MVGTGVGIRGRVPEASTRRVTRTKESRPVGNRRVASAPVGWQEAEVREAHCLVVPASGSSRGRVRGAPWHRDIPVPEPRSGTGAVAGASARAVHAQLAPMHQRTNSPKHQLSNVTERAVAGSGIGGSVRGRGGSASSSISRRHAKCALSRAEAGRERGVLGRPEALLRVLRLGVREWDTSFLHHSRRLIYWYST